MKIITGGTGLVGSAFKSGKKLGSRDFDLTSLEKTRELFSKYKPSTVIHTAARVGGLGANMSYPVQFFEENLAMNMNIIKCSHEFQVKKLVCFLSTCIFPDKVEYPLEEHKVELGPPHSSNFAYAYAKRMADVQIQAYNKQYGTDYFCVVPTNVYGPNDNFSLQNGHVIPMLIHKCYLAKKNETPFEVWGTGKPLREFVYSQDVADCVDLLLVDNYKDKRPVIITTSQEYTIKQVVDLIVEYMEFEGPIVWRSDKPDGQYRKPSSNKKLLSVIGDYEFTPLEVGLKKTVNWFNKNYDTIRK